MMEFTLERNEDTWVARFEAMAAPCEIHLCCKDKSEAEHLVSLAVSGTRRIEQKYSRYRDNNIVHAINSSNGAPVAIDEETARLLQFAGQCFEISGGLFDITSGILRTAWKFDGGEVRPDQKVIDGLLAKIGWPAVSLGTDSIRLKPGMEIDLGGIGKEYAVDRVAQDLAAATDSALMVNYGGDIRVISPESAPRLWTIGIEDPWLENSALGQVELSNGAIATSGDTKRFCTYRKKRLGHILNPKTGWPVVDAPRSVTVIGNNCTEAGLMATLAILHGTGAEQFLKEQDLTYHCVW